MLRILLSLILLAALAVQAQTPPSAADLAGYGGVTLRPTRTMPLPSAALPPQGRILMPGTVPDGLLRMSPLSPPAMRRCGPWPRPAAT